MALSGDVLVGKAATLVGYAFVAATIVIVARPGAPLRNEYDQWRDDRAARNIIIENWNELTAPRTRLGSTDTDHELVEFIDYRCVFCRAFEDTVAVVYEAKPDLAIVLRHLPRPGDVASRSAALAVICAERQGTFETMHRYLLTDTVWPERSWANTAVEVGVADPDRLLACMASDNAAAVLVQDSVWASRLSIRVTPAILTRQHGLHRGITSSESLVSWLRLAR